MLKLALSEARTPNILIDETEIRATDQLSYSYLTLTTLKRQEPNAIWVLLLGSDAFAGFDRWCRWKEILDLCHLGILTRPGFDTANQETMKRRLDARGTLDFNELRTHSHGLMVDVPVTPLTLSSSEIRRTILNGLSPQFLMPDVVWDFIESQRIYQSR
jgi:nicotinate-nucleotide adenylyltransferase